MSAIAKQNGYDPDASPEEIVRAVRPLPDPPLRPWGERPTGTLASEPPHAPWCHSRRATIGPPAGLEPGPHIYGAAECNCRKGAGTLASDGRVPWPTRMPKCCEDLTITGYADLRPDGHHRRCEAVGTLASIPPDECDGAARPGER